ncbi:hypothetical protein AXF42_Ash008058 [Apostasia shenzhenica]|uniref:DUF7866 domain-containing protein n=1 Tax=Apostasia shenzhenica TaxID=1088818 RepID=A0A2I0A8E9_9ASPA|nr:hypothetical protein AXF42_Ash008058 [Apostasia shenzhenica]
MAILSLLLLLLLLLPLPLQINAGPPTSEPGSPAAAGNLFPATPTEYRPVEAAVLPSGTEGIPPALTRGQGSATPRPKLKGIDVEGLHKQSSAWFNLMQRAKPDASGGYKTCSACRCCSKSSCVTANCCYDIDCNLPGKPFGSCAFVPKTCDCNSCTN